MELFNKIFKMTLPLAIIAALALLAGSVSAAGREPAKPATATTSGGVYSGVFEGVLYGDRGSEAPVRLELTQDGRNVSGDITVGNGLLVDGGRCGLAAVPAATQTAEGRVSPADPYKLDAAAEFDVSGITVRLDLMSELSLDGQSLEAEANIDLPWLCGRDPAVSGLFERAS